MSGLTGRTAVVTGAASGMGRAITLAFARAGGHVIAGDIDTDAGPGVVKAAADSPGTVVFQTADVSDADSVAALVAAAEDRFGALHCAVNAAGIEGEGVGVAELDDERFDRIMAVNLRGTFLCIKHEIAAMLRHGTYGSIVNIASTSSFRPQLRQPAYAASKHAVIGLTRAAALDYAHAGIRVNAICPGAIDTPMLRAAIDRSGGREDQIVSRLSPLGRLGSVAEIAAAALWLCSDDALFTTGHALSVDGGFLGQ